MASAACGEDGETSSTGVIQNGTGGQGGSSGGSGQGGSGISGSSGQAGAAGSSVVAGAGGSEALLPCKFAACTGVGVCYERIDGEECAKPTTLEAWSRLGCTIGSPDVSLSAQDTTCCYNSFCYEGRPLYIDGSLTHASTSRSLDWG